MNPDEVIGKYIDYMPEEGVYSNITNNKVYTGTDSNSNDFMTDTSLKWRIWSLNENTLTIVADKPISVGGYRNLGGLNLANSNGYNNGVKILNDICMDCYSNSSIDAVARSINIDDIENVLDIAVWRPERYRTKGTSAKVYTDRKDYKNTICYPFIYSLEEKSLIDGIEKEKGIKRSNQDELYGGKQNYLKAENTLSPIQTAWNNTRLTEKNFVNPNYYYLIFKEGFSNVETLMSYYLASRSVDLTENHINFGMFEVSMGKRN
jgi:hypothetical protein